MTTEELKRYGYCITSRRSRIASRIDRPDWKEVMSAHRIAPSADYYRRCISKDQVIVTSRQVSELKNSGDGYEKFRGKP